MAERASSPERGDRAEALARLILAFRPPDEATRVALADWDPEPLEPLRTEYTRLFVHARPGPPAAPEALAWIGAGGIGAQTALLDEISAAFRERGLALSEEAGRPPDHLTVLLEFLYTREAEGDEPGAIACRERFLAPWVGRFLDRLEESAPSPFYRRAGEELARCLDLRRTT